MLFLLYLAHEKTCNRKNGSDRTHQRNLLAKGKECEDNRDYWNQVNAHGRADSSKFFTGDVPCRKAEGTRPQPQKAKVEPVERICKTGFVESRVEDYGDIVDFRRK